MVDCDECLFRMSCAMTMHECRDHGGGKPDPKIVVKKQQDEITRLREKLIEHGIDPAEDN